ncbi:hypothetical protein G3580_18215 [Nitrogeniibacter mangrovi]|uniref:Uncharacterized protein n=1 Tax=Nitrogeniibacter mangrovi TaxID=2016596 RepID=A0A6C1B8U4_9RHOO|nr:hypothetical protein [Nitrogeniibacter mangrovi]QID19379.1 hypothetical protein G3580_18215 [Nitrogeniibacter mangrovi]
MKHAMTIPIALLTCLSAYAYALSPIGEEARKRLLVTDTKEASEKICTETILNQCTKNTDWEYVTANIKTSVDEHVAVADKGVKISKGQVRYDYDCNRTEHWYVVGQKSGDKQHSQAAHIVANYVLVDDLFMVAHILHENKIGNCGNVIEQKLKSYQQ